MAGRHSWYVLNPKGRDRVLRDPILSYKNAISSAHSCLTEPLQKCTRV